MATNVLRFAHDYEECDRIARKKKTKRKVFTNTAKKKCTNKENDGQILVFVS